MSDHDTSIAMAGGRNPPASPASPASPAQSANQEEPWYRRFGMLLILLLIAGIALFFWKKQEVGPIAGTGTPIQEQPAPQPAPAASVAKAKPKKVVVTQAAPAATAIAVATTGGNDALAAALARAARAEQALDAQKATTASSSAQPAGEVVEGRVYRAGRNTYVSRQGGGRLCQFTIQGQLRHETFVDGATDAETEAKCELEGAKFLASHRPAP